MKVELQSRVMLNNHEQRIYNEYLRATRTAAGKPYKLRKNFDDIDASSVLYVQRIARVLNKFHHISMADFFAAPHQVYGSGEYFDLKFFASQRALKTYTTYMQQQINADPDAPQVLQRVMESLRSLKEFFAQHHLCMESYAQHVTNNLPTFVLHLKERKLSPYVMQEIPQATSIIRAQDAEVLRFMFGDGFFEDLNAYRTRYLASQQCKVLVRAGIKKISTNTCTTNNLV